ncbi:hypothetical protein BKA82DRAFT_991291 [Pisolithus tinctorius]|uniref:F-box domain-containing protein n=1 Tax=Pisolithus tinctorius Marx 270 TaxID=870435 RepID=A0A0C3PK08_PISTI|nr:hypothetical protein BKA82DRAFT_991291 [Pisolithus tinctorius]KIO14535.1 hypothetical protein M404DRAFT_991291 [Pisolithus tinctorius Marx 270]
MRTLWDVLFPSLRRATIHTTQQCDYLPFLDRHHARMLENLDLGESIKLDHFLAPASLKTLRLQCSPLIASLLPSRSSLRTLTELSIFGSSGALLPDSIHLPLLDSLTVALEDPRSFLAAIVTPRLTYFNYMQPPKEDLCWSTVFADLEEKFSNVQHLCLKTPENSPLYTNTSADGAFAICAAFPGVRHAEMDAYEFISFCWAEEEGSSKAIADRWMHLEHLSLEQCGCWIPDSFVKWLGDRQVEGRPTLQVTLFNFDTKGKPNCPWMISLYNSLHEYCLLEMHDVPLTLHLTVRPSDSVIYGNPPIPGMLASAISTEFARATIEMDL